MNNAERRDALRLREAAGMASGAAQRLLQIDPRADAAAWSIRASDALTDFCDTGAVADLQGAAAFALLALTRALGGSAAPPAEIAKIGAVVAGEAIEIIDGEIKKLDSAIASTVDRAGKQTLRVEKARLMRERTRIAAALEKSQSEAS